MKINKLIIVGLSALLVTATSAVAKEKGEKGPKGPRKTFEEIDTDKDGKVSEAEFVAAGKNEEKAKARFAKVDKDGDGFLSKEDLAKGGKGKKGKKGPKKDKAE